MEAVRHAVAMEFIKTRRIGLAADAMPVVQNVMDQEAMTVLITSAPMDNTSSSTGEVDGKGVEGALQGAKNV